MNHKRVTGESIPSDGIVVKYESDVCDGKRGDTNVIVTINICVGWATYHDFLAELSAITEKYRI